MPPVRPRPRVRDLFVSRTGATAVEFAMVALPFFALLFTILELGMMFMTATCIEAATVAAARQIRTGQLQAGSSNSAAGFQTLICNNVSWISASDCMSNMSIDVRTFSTFASISVTPPIANNAINTAQLTYNSGGPCDIVLVRAFYPYTLITPLLEPGLPNLGPNQRLITTAVAFRNEDWQAEGPPCT